MDLSKRRALKLALLGVLLVNLCGVRASFAEDKLPSLISIDEEKTETLVVSSTEKPEEKSSTELTGAAQTSSSTSEQPKTDATQDEQASTSTTAESVGPRAESAVKEQDKPSQIEQGPKPTGERDINILLASKDDTENDLGSPNDSRRNEPKPPLVVVSEESGVEKQQSELDSPVDVKPNDDRFHYSLSKPLADETKPTKEPEQELVSNAPVTTTPGSSIVKGKSESLEPESKPSKPDSVEAETTSPEKNGSADVTKATPTEEPVRVVDETTLATQSKDKTTTVSSTSTVAPVQSIAKPRLEPADKAAANATKSDDTEKKPIESSTSKTLVDGQGNSTVKQNEKPVSVPSVLATALGSALGSAVQPIFTSLVSNKDKVQPVSTAPASATTEPNLSSSVSTRKPVLVSSTDKWDKWSTTTTSSPPTRRRPILPSIRRRFRPYNRFSPFPWGGAESYSPAGSDSDFIGEPAPPSSRPSWAPSNPGSTVTLKPRRRSTTEAPKEGVKPSSSSGSEGSSSVDHSGSDGSNISTRRRHQHGNKRRPQQHGPSSDDGSEYDDNTRRFPSHHRHHGGRPHFHRHHHNNEHLEPFAHRPGSLSGSGGVGGLFNAPGSAMGSAFDLLNPFTSWLDDLSRPKPPRGPSLVGSPARVPGHRPSNHGGEYPDSSNNGPELGPGSHHDHGHSGRPHNGREDYNHDCHHDHDHDHDHDHNHDHDHDHHHDHHHRPQRPSREPYRPRPHDGDYDTYPPGSSSHSYGRRPTGGRPYNREADSSSSNQEPEGNTDIVSGDTPFSSFSTSTRGERQGEPLAPRSRPFRPSIFSPFDSLFGALDEDLFSLRQSPGESPFARSPVDSTRTFDAIVTSPKISMASSSGTRDTSDSQPKVVNSTSAL